MSGYLRFLFVLLLCVASSLAYASDTPQTKSDEPKQTQKSSKKKKKKKSTAQKKTEEKQPTEAKLPEPSSEPKPAAENQLPPPKPPAIPTPEKKESEQPSTVTPAPDRSKYAVTDRDQVDSDFAIQGEYMGVVQPDAEHTDMGGLQVVALGDGKFSGMLFRGGLPGAGWDRSDRQTVAGQRADNGDIVLQNDKWLISMGNDQAVVRDGSGKQWAAFPKINRISSTQDTPPPAGAVVLFDGQGTVEFDNARVTPDGLLSPGAFTKMPVHDFHLHVEFRTPYMPYARGQGRGNSGIYIQRRYEVQILDSFGLEGVDNECGGIYKQKAPDVNMCLPPLSWQTYDIYFASPQWNDSGHRLVPANITVLHNGELIHFNYRLKDKTGGGTPEGKDDLPILLQNHGNPVAFRNIWIEGLNPIASESGYSAECSNDGGLYSNRGPFRRRFGY